MSEPYFNGKYPCNNYGNRQNDYSFCKPCPEKICEGCSIETLSKALSKTKRDFPITFETTSGNKVEL